MALVSRGARQWRRVLADSRILAPTTSMASARRLHTPMLRAMRPSGSCHCMERSEVVDRGALGSRAAHVRRFGSLPSHQVVGLPALSPTMERGTIVSWGKNEGESFGPGDVLAEVETDKATVAFEAQDEGTVAKIIVAAGSEVKVGEPILVIVEDAAHVSAFANFKLEAGSAAAPPATAAAPSPAPAPSASPAPAPSAPPTPAPKATPAPTRAPGARVAASPLAKSLASQLGINLSQLAGTGPGGRIIAADVREFVPSAAAPTASTPAPARAAPAAAAPVAGVGYTDYPLSESAKAIAAKLTVAKQTVPHYYLTVDVVLDKLLAMRASLNAEMAEGESLSVHDFLLKAAALACKQVPDANASWHGDFVRHYSSVDVNVAVGVGDGLLAPVLRGVESKGLRALSKEVRAAAAGAASGELPPEALQTGTITVVNIGIYGVRSVAPIVSLPQAVALGIGAIENRVVPRVSPKEGEGVYEVKPGVTVTLSCDHRVIDGAVGAQWLSVFKGLVEDPATLLL